MPVAPSSKSVAEKLQMKSGRTVLILNKPSNYDQILGKLPTGLFVADHSAKAVDIVQIFVKSKEQLERELPDLKKLINTSGMIWVTYPKGTSEMKSDINRDSIAAFAETIGLEGVAMVAIDIDWAALRLKVVASV